MMEGIVFVMLRPVAKDLTGANICATWTNVFYWINAREFSARTREEHGYHPCESGPCESGTMGIVHTKREDY